MVKIKRANSVMLDLNLFQGKTGASRAERSSRVPWTRRHSWEPWQAWAIRQAWP